MLAVISTPRHHPSTWRGHLEAWGTGLVKECRGAGDAEGGGHIGGVGAGR